MLRNAHNFVYTHVDLFADPDDDQHQHEDEVMEEDDDCDGSELEWSTPLSPSLDTDLEMPEDSGISLMLIDPLYMV